MSKQRLSDLLALSYVSRWAITPMFRQQTVAEHSFRVAAIAAEVHSRMFDMTTSPDYAEMPRFQAEIIYWALIHDAPESYTGDLPSPFKSVLGKNILFSAERQVCPWWADAQSAASITTRAVVHVADTVEAVTWVTRHAPDAKWKFHPEPEELLVNVLRRRIDDECKSYAFQYKELRLLPAAVKIVMEELGICEPIDAAMNV